MRVALVHDYLNQYGGGERVLENLMEIFPNAPIYTLLYDEAKTMGRFRGRVKKTSFLDFPLARNHHRIFIPAMPLAAQSLNLGNDYDLIISDSAGFAKGISYGKNTKHISYIHTPLRYAWETDYINLKFKILNLKLSDWLFTPILNYLRWWDYRAAQKPDVLIANSNFIANKIKNYYNRDAKVIYPPVDTSQFYPEIRNPKSEIRNYYLAIGRLLHYKRFDLIIDAFAKLKLPLKIVGGGPEHQNLKFKIKNLKLNNVELLPFVENDEALRKLYNGAKALIFPQVEDFGLVAAEAQACGTPIIAYAAGGALEIVKNGATGILFGEQTVSNLMEAVKRFEKLKFNRGQISRLSRRFSKENFQQKFVDTVNSLVV